MEVDTGASVLVISMNTYKKLFPNTSLNASTGRLKTYTGEPMPVAGEIYSLLRYVQYG